MTIRPGLAWAVKDNLVSYVEALDDGIVEALAPATRSGAGFWFPPSGSTTALDASDPGTVLQFLGTARFTGHWGALDLELTDPRVELNGREGTLLIRDRGSRDPDKVVPFADLAVDHQERAVDDRWSIGATATLTGHGSLLLGGQYSVGEPMSPVRISFAPRHG